MDSHKEIRSIMENNLIRVEELKTVNRDLSSSSVSGSLCIPLFPSEKGCLIYKQ